MASGDEGAPKGQAEALSRLIIKQYAMSIIPVSLWAAFFMKFCGLSSSLNFGFSLSNPLGNFECAGAAKILVQLLGKQNPLPFLTCYEDPYFTDYY